jgi:hypothetical protein
MSILKIKNKGGDEMQFIGINVPILINKYLALYALSKEVSKSIVIRNILENWMIGQRSKDSIRSLIDKIVDKCVLLWHIEKTVHPNTTLSSYLEQLRIELIQKGIEGVHINQIINGVRDGETTNNKTTKSTDERKS